MTRPMKIAVLPGDGIGPEVTEAAKLVLETVAGSTGVELQFLEALIGGCAIDETGNALPPETLDVARQCDAVLLGAVGGPKWDTTDPDKPRPEQGLLGIREGLQLYANIRPCQIHSALIGSSNLKEEVIQGTDFWVFRELTGGMYFGESGHKIDVEHMDADHDYEWAWDTEIYYAHEIARIVRKACQFAREIGADNVCSVDKANVLESSRLWRKIAHRVVEEEFPDIKMCDLLVDNCTMQIIDDPRQFRVIVTSNMFGDIITDEASMITGSMGMLPSASMGDGTLGLYEPIHGSYPKATGQNVANPLAAILSAAMMLRYSLGLLSEASAIEDAVEKVLNEGYRTVDLLPKALRPLPSATIEEHVALLGTNPEYFDGSTSRNYGQRFCVLGTEEMTQAIIDRLVVPPQECSRDDGLYPYG